MEEIHKLDHSADEAFATVDENIHIKRSKNTALDLLQGTGIPAQHDEDIFLSFGKEGKPFAVELVATRFADDQYGWVIVETDQNYFKGCIDEGQVVQWRTGMATPQPQNSFSVLKDADDEEYFDKIGGGLSDDVPRQYPVISKTIQK